MSRDVPVLMTTAFQRDYRKASALLASRAESESHRLVRSLRDSPNSWMDDFKRFKGVAPETLLEVRLTSGDRMWVHVGNDRVTYFRMGEHDLLPHKSGAEVRKELKSALADAQPVAGHWLPGRHRSFLPEDGGIAQGLVVDTHEVSPDWVHYLSDQQHQVAEEVLLDVWDNLHDGDSTHYLLGGPGTGKTTILAWLLLHLHDDPDAVVRLAVTDQLAAYIELSTGWDLSELRRPWNVGDRVDVLLLDDPAALALLAEADRLQREGALGNVVVALDPLQLSESITDAQFVEAITDYGATSYWLTACYRQKEVVGRAAQHVMDVVAASSPYLIQDKKTNHARTRAWITENCNRIDFVNPTGFNETYAKNQERNWARYVDWLHGLDARGVLWSHWPPLLVVDDPEVELPAGWYERLESISYARTDIRHIESEKGLEYQHVAIILGKQRYEAIETGFEGSGGRKYDAFRLLRIPFTRARDSLAVFVFGD